MQPLKTFFLVCGLCVVAGVIALPQELPVSFSLLGKQVSFTVRQPALQFSIGSWKFAPDWQLKKGLDIQGGMQIVLQAEMDAVQPEDRQTALESAREIIHRRVDLYGVSEPVVQTAQQGESYRLVVELPGVQDPQTALALVGKTAELDFRLMGSASSEASQSAVAFLESFIPTGITGKNLHRSQVQFDPQTQEPVIGLEFDEEGRKLFGEVTSKHTGKVLAIFIDGYPVAMPVINTPILDGRAVMSGGFQLDEAKQLAIQLNSGALPVSITILEQRTLGASLGAESIQKSILAGLVGIVMVVLFMVALYGWQGVLAAVALSVYAVITIALYKLLGITVTLPGIAGLLLSIGMAVDSNILVFERMKEELRRGKAFRQAMELGFGRAWDSIKDANVATILTALILVNPLDFPFLNSSGLVRGFGVTLLIGVMTSLFTGIVVTRTLMRLFLKGPSHD